MRQSADQFAARCRHTVELRWAAFEGLALVDGLAYIGAGGIGCIIPKEANEMNRTDLQGARAKSAAAWEHLDAIAQEISAESWPHGDKARGALHVANIQHVLLKLGEPERLPVIDTWNEWIDSEAIRRQAELEAWIEDPKPARNAFVQFAWGISILILPALFGYYLTGSVGIGIGFVMTMILANTISDELAEERKTEAKAIEQFRQARLAADYIQSWKIRKEDFYFWGETYPWGYPTGGDKPERFW